MTLEEAQQQVAVHNATIVKAQAEIELIESRYILDNCEFQVGDRVVVNPQRKPYTVELTRISVNIPDNGYGKPWFQYYGRRILANGKMSDNVSNIWQDIVKADI